jgi:hypothetical protein
MGGRESHPGNSHRKHAGSSEKPGWVFVGLRERSLIATRAEWAHVSHGCRIRLKKNLKAVETEFIFMTSFSI